MEVGKINWVVTSFFITRTENDKIKHALSFHMILKKLK